MLILNTLSMNTLIAILLIKACSKLSLSITMYAAIPVIAPYLFKDFVLGVPLKKG